MSPFFDVVLTTWYTSPQDGLQGPCPGDSSLEWSEQVAMGTAALTDLLLDLLICDASAVGEAREFSAASHLQALDPAVRLLEFLTGSVTGIISVLG